jgi:hypothetical protein
MAEHITRKVHMLLRPYYDRRPWGNFDEAICSEGARFHISIITISTSYAQIIRNIRIAGLRSKLLFIEFLNQDGTST